MNKILVALGFIALIITCTFAVREPISLTFIVGSFVLIGWFFGKIAEKAEFNHRLSNSERKGTLLFCAAGFLVVSIISNIGFLFWVNSQTPIFGEEYVERERYEDMKSEAKKQEYAQEAHRVIAEDNAERVVKATLKDPESAVFSGAKLGKSEAICGYVNAKNSFGAYAGNQRYVVASSTPYLDDGSSSFISLWSNYCL